ncbi:MAG: TonB-dependent receptor, partial [Candidatus Marinimicrobia bacterium]|nr:TonB-dependent receptor [Candidatus Neomarinimicrobiota bacterium]
MTKNVIRLIISLIFFTYLCQDNLLGHDGHKKKPKMPAIGIVQGTVTDSSAGIPIEYASISMVDNHDGSVVTGGLSKKDGSFIVREIPLGQYIVMVEFIGYAKKEIGPLNIFPGDGGSIEHFIGEVALKISSINLDAVEVVGDESQFIQTVDKQIFKVGKNLTAAGGTGFDLLRKVPTVDVDIDGEVSIAGDANVTILIDGKRSGLTGSNRRGVVDNIQVGMVEKVEVITNPSAKYDPDGVGGIINIVMKRGAFDGFNGSISGMAGEYEKRNLNGNINYRTDKWNIFAGTSTRSGNNIGKGYREFTYEYSDSSSSIYQNTLRKKNPANIGARLGGDYYPSKSSTISYTYMYGNHNETTKEQLEYMSPFYRLTESKSEDIGIHHDHSLSYENKFGTNDRKLTASIDLNFEEDDIVQYNIENSSIINDLGTNSDTDVKEKNESQTLRIDYEDDLNEGLSIETGIKATLKSYSTDYNYLEKLYNNDYDEDIYAAYASLTYDITEKFGIKAGARFEQVETNATLIPSSSNIYTDEDSLNIISTIIDNAIESSPYKNPYTKVYPSVFLIYKLSPMQTIQFGYSKKVNRPGRRTISPFPRNTFDISRIRNGNPYLDPEYSDGAELKFSSNSRKLNFNAGLSYKLVKDNIMWWDRDMVEFDGDVYEVLTADNSENSESMGSSLIINYRPMPLVSIMFSRWGWSNKTYGNGESDLNGDSKGAYNRGMLTVNIPKVVRLELTVGGRGKMKFTTGSSPGNFSADIGLQKSFMDNRLSVTVKLDDVFDTKKFIINTENTITNPITNEVYSQ